MRVSLAITLALAALCSVHGSTPTSIACDPTPGARHVMTRTTAGGAVETNLDVHALGDTAIGGEIFRVVCGQGSEATGAQETCLDCKPSVATSGGTTSGLSGVVAPKSSAVQLRRTDGTVTTGEVAVQTQGATVLANEAAIVDDSVYFDSALTTAYISADSTTPTRGVLRSGLVHGVANAWKPEATGSVTVDATAYAGEESAFILSFDALDFGDDASALSGLDVTVSGDDAVNILQAAGSAISGKTAASGGASAQLAIDTVKLAADKKTDVSLVTRVCPILIKSKKLNVQLRAPNGNPTMVDQTRRNKMHYKESGSANGEAVTPRGMVLRWSAIDMRDLQVDIDASLTVSKFNTMFDPLSTIGADHKAAIQAYVHAQTGQDPTEPCLDIMSSATSVAKRNWPADHDEDCTDTGYILYDANSPVWSSCYSCESCRSTFEGLDASTQLQEIRDYLEQCPMQGVSSTSSLQGMGGWGSDECSASYATKYCRWLRDPYAKVEGDAGNAPPQYYTAMSKDLCGRWACSQDAGRPECHGAGAGSTLRHTLENDGGASFTENAPNWPKGCYVYTDQNGGKATYFNEATTGAAPALSDGKKVEVIYMSEAARYGAAYEQHCGATCMKCFHPGSSGRRSGLRTGSERDAPAIAGPTSEEDKAVRDASFAELEPLPAPEIYDPEVQRALDLERSEESRKTGRNLLSVGSWYAGAKTTGDTQCGDVSIFNNMGVIGSHCSGTCSFHYTRPWCQPDSTGSLSAYSNARGIGCYAPGSAGNVECAKKPQCYQSTYETDSIDDNALRVIKGVSTSCSDRCKAAVGRPCGYTDAACHNRNVADKAADQAACAANGACAFFEAGRCFDDFSAYFTARAASTMDAAAKDKHSPLTKLQTQAEVDRAVSTGLVCPNEDPRQCGTKDLFLQYDRSDANVAEAEARTCEALPLINPNSAASADEALHKYDGGNTTAIRYDQALQLPCLAFRQCGYSIARGCYTKAPTDCVAAKKAAMSCDDNTQTQVWRDNCELAAGRICNNVDNEENVISPGFESAKHMRTDKTKQAIAEAIAKFREMMAQLRKANTIFGLTQDETMTANLNLVAQRQAYTACVAHEGDASGFDGKTLAEKATYYNSVGKRVACVEKLLAYAKAKIVAEYGAVGDGKASETIKLTVEKSMDKYKQSGWARQGDVVRVDFCSAVFANAGMASSASEFGGTDDQLTSTPCPTGMEHKKTYVSLENLWMFVLDSTTAESASDNRFLMLAGDIQVSGQAEQFCSHAVSTPTGENALAKSYPGLPTGYHLDATSCANSAGRGIVSNIPLISQVVYEVTESGGAGSRRLLSTSTSSADAVCPPGSYYAGVHVGPRCWNAHITNQYFAPGTDMSKVTCHSPALNEANVDASSPCHNGMKANECASPDGVGNDGRIYWLIEGDSQNNWYSTNAHCVAASAIQIESVGVKQEAEADRVIDRIQELEDKIGDAKCFSGNDAGSKQAVKTLYQGLGNCPAAGN